MLQIIEHSDSLNFWEQKMALLQLKHKAAQKYFGENYFCSFALVKKVKMVKTHQILRTKTFYIDKTTLCL